MAMPGKLFKFAIIVLMYLETSRVNAASNQNSKKKFVPTFKIEYAWLSNYDGGYIARFKLPIHMEIPSWNMALLFPERVYNITLWQATLQRITPDGEVVYCKQTKWNGHKWPGNVLEQRFLLRFNITPGIDYNGYSGPKPDIVFLDKVFLPDRNNDFEHEMSVVNYTFYSKPRSVYFRKPSMATVPVTTTQATTTTASTTTKHNPFLNTGQEREYDGQLGRGSWWFIGGAGARPSNRSTTTTTAKTTTTRPPSWWKFAHKTTTTPPQPTLASVNCTQAAEQRKVNCGQRSKPKRPCFMPQCDGERFKTLQCRRRVRRCWCVDMRSGVRVGNVVKYNNAEKLNCHQGDESRTTPPTTLALPIWTTTPVYIPEGFSENLPDGQPAFAPRNSYDYAEVLHKSHLFFEAQRSGTLPKNRRISWRQSAHTRDGSECGKDLSGGYYHSGDYIKFGFPTAFAMTQLAWSYLEAKDSYKASWQTKFLKDTLKWGTDYFIKAHTGQSEFYGQVGDPIYENDKWTRPQDMKVPRPCYSITSRSPGSDLASETSAALAATAAVWIASGSDKTNPYVQLLIKHAKELQQFAEKYRGVYHMSIRAAANYYPSSGYEDELAWAAIWLYIATGEEQFLANAKTKYFQFSLFQQETEFSWDRKGAGVQLLLAKYTNSKKYLKPVVAFCDSVLPDGMTQYTPYGLLYISKWGSIRYACNAAFICMVTSKLKMLSREKKTKYRKFGEDQIDYVLGKTGKSFVIGFGAKYPTQPLHRASSCSVAGTCSSEDRTSAFDNPQVLVGAVVGGPSEKDLWMNDRTNAMTNAVTLDFNSAVQSAVAVLRQFQIEYKAWFDSQWSRKPN